jgi:hypothetical protein
MEALLAVTGVGVSQVDTADLKRGSEDVGGGVEDDSVAPADCEQLVVVCGVRSPGPELVEARAWIIGYQAFELNVHSLDGGFGKKGGHDDEPPVTESGQLFRGGAPTESQLADPVDGNLDAHRRSMPDRYVRLAV